MPFHLALDLDQAARHLALLDPADVPHIFAVLPEAEGASGKPRHYYGRLPELAPRFEWAHRKGCGIFVAVNAMQGRRRRNDCVARVRALWAERDGPGAPLPLPPSLVVATSPGRCHEYLLTDAVPPDAPEARALNRRLAVLCASDPGATDPARVLRLAGSWNLKGEPFLARITEASGQCYAVDVLRASLPDLPPPDTDCPAVAHAGRTACHHLAAAAVADPERYLAVVTERLIAELGHAPQGARNTTLNRLAFRLARLGLDADAIQQTLGSTALAIGLNAAETEATIRSAVRGASRAA